MGQDQLYLLETLIKKIILRKQQAVKVLEDLIINIKFDHIVNFDIDFCSFIPPEALTVESGDQKIIPNTGKSFLFVSRPSSLRQLLDVDPVQINLLEDITHVAGVDVKLQKEFAEMVKLFESIGIVKSCTQEEVYELFDETKKVVGTISVQLRMSCFGRNIQTAYQLTKERDKNQCLFKQRNTSKTFMVERLPDERTDNEAPIGPLYSGWTGAKVESDVHLNENVSLTGLFERGTMGTKLSMYNPPAGGLEDFDIVSMCYRPQENKFFDFLNLISMDVQTNPRGTTLNIQKEKLERAQDLLKTMEGTVSYGPDPPMEDPLALTSEMIEKRLCGNKDCPAVQKFKEYGIGPLATGKGLGTLYDEVEPPVTYGLSHTYGVMHEYGPYGVFSRPKHEELPFVPPKNEFDVEMEKKQYEKKPYLCTYCKSPPEKAKRKKKKHNKEGSSEQCPIEKCEPIRLRGGGDKQNCVLRLRGGGGDDEEKELSATPDSPLAGGSSPDQATTSSAVDDIVVPKSPILECKSVMNQFDDILAAYRKALGPCGQAICPYAQTMAEESCRKACPPKVPTGKDDQQSCSSVPCGISVCPYTPEKKNKVFPAGCGSPRCAYAQYKLGLVDEDAELELQFLPPALTTNCGDHRCKYPPPVELPPIHWDCPDPLPKGQCKNPNCPFLPPPLRKFKTMGVKTGPCGSPMCPYALPQPCPQPTCPFIPQPCPMPPRTCTLPASETTTTTLEEYEPTDAKGAQYKGTFEDACPNPDCGVGKKKKRRSREERTRRSSKNEETCNNPDCPFAKKTERQRGGGSKHVCANPYCPYNAPKTKPCENPYCPKKQAPTCPPPMCPYMQEQGIKDKRGSSDATECSIPDCDYNKEKQAEDSSLCENPDCPFAKKNKKKNKSKKKNKGDSDSICSNPDCPENQGKNDKDKESICSNPECPSSQVKQPSKVNKEGGDAECALAEGDSVCSNPDCPEAKARAQEESDCSNPDCPYAKNNKKRQSNGKSEHSEICEDSKCPYGLPLPAACGIPNCPYDLLLSQQKNSKRFSSDRRTSEHNKGDSMAVVLQTNEVCAENPEDCDNPDCAFYEDEEGHQHPVDHKKKKRKKYGRRKKRGKFVYSIGDVYPGVKVGHKECVHPVFHVPPNMGWLWNVWTPMLNLKPRRGWRPGALTKEIAARIRAHRRAKGLGILHLPHFRKGGKAIDDEDLKVVPKPTLHIQKKEGAYWITMNPLKDPNSLVENEDPYMDCTPMTFKITKNKKVDEDGCYCDGEEEPLPSGSSSESELDIEFTPPAGIIHPERFKKRPNTVCVTAQYDPADFAAKKEGKKGKGDKGGKGDKKGKGGKGGKGKKKK